MLPPRFSPWRSSFVSTSWAARTSPSPRTIQDHVARETYPSRDAIVLSRRAALLLPRGSTVTVLVPSEAPDHDATLCYTAVGLMPHHQVVLASLEAKPRYVIAVREPLNHPDYRLLTAFREGSIYELR